MKVIRECLSLPAPILWRLSGGGIRKLKKKKEKKKEKKKSEEKNLSRNYKTSRPTDGMPNSEHRGLTQRVNWEITFHRTQRVNMRPQSKGHRGLNGNSHSAQDTEG